MIIIGKKWLTLAVVSCLSAISLAKDSVVISVGYGATEEAATKKALIDAVQQTVGVLTYSEEVVKDDDVAKDSIHQLSNGFVSSYKKLSKKKGRDGLWTVKLSAVVRSGTVADFLKRKNVETKVDLKDSWARLSTSLRSKKSALDLYNDKIPHIKRNLFKVSLIDLKSGRVTTGVTTPYTEEDLDGNVTCVWVYKLTPDLKFWNESAYPLLYSCFKTLSVGRKTITVKYGAPTFRRGSSLESKKPRYLPPMKSIKSPKMDSKNTGFHPKLFDSTIRRPYQGELKHEGVSGLYSLVLEKPLNSTTSSVTMFYFTKEVKQRIVPHANSLWNFNFSVELADGSNYTQLKEDRLDRVIGSPTSADFVNGKSAPLYFGPWFQLGYGHNLPWGVRKSMWPNWINASYFVSKYNGWPFIGIDRGRPFPVSTHQNEFEDAAPFVEWIYMPAAINIPLDSLPKITQLKTSIEVTP